MVERILQQVATLKTDILRRGWWPMGPMICVPLASLHGYLETLLMKKGRLHEEYRTFSTLPSSKANGRELLGELFELARLDSREARIQCEQFSLTELVQDVCQSFNSPSANRIALKSSFTDDLPFCGG